jgi:hypothetical protein
MVGNWLIEYFSGGHWWQDIWGSRELDLGHSRGSWNLGVDLKFRFLEFNKIFYWCASEVLTVRSHPATTNYHLGEKCSNGLSEIVVPKNFIATDCPQNWLPEKNFCGFGGAQNSWAKKIFVTSCGIGIDSIEPNTGILYGQIFPVYQQKTSQSIFAECLFGLLGNLSFAVRNFFYLRVCFYDWYFYEI